VEYQQIAAAGLVFLPSTDSVPFGVWGCGTVGVWLVRFSVWHTVGSWDNRTMALFLGSLLGEARGWWCGAGLFLVSRLQRTCTVCGSLWGSGCVGCVVRGCCLRTT